MEQLLPAPILLKIGPYRLLKAKVNIWGDESSMNPIEHVYREKDSDDGGGALNGMTKGIAIKHSKRKRLMGISQI